MSQLNMFDYLNGITIGSIAAEMATALEADWLKPLTAMIVYVLLVVILEKLTSVSIKLRRFCVGKAILLYDNGVVFDRNFTRSHITLSEFLTTLRVKGYFNLTDIQTVIMESDGHLSILPKSDKRPVNPSDLSIAPQPEKILRSVILDGEILYDNLKETGKDEKWLLTQLKNQSVKSLSDVFLATCDSNLNITVYKKTSAKPENDPFQ